ncbi:MAG: hypothetical protein HOB79_09540 [Rhodospirillaceae bacterium]|nr:hypothetical protein [Rhodospirillaceae bacterium]
MDHGEADEGDAEDQPVWLTTEQEKPNGAAILMLTDSVEDEQAQRV